MVSIIVAIARNRAIGCANKLLWHISEDMRRFKAITTGHPVIMGRKTFESIGRPLPNRTNVVITRMPESYDPAGCTVVGSLIEAIEMFPRDEEIFVIGGGEIYEQALPLAEKLYLTIVHDDYEADTFFPEWDPKEWTEISRESYSKGEEFDKSFTFVDYVRKDKK